jgi:hypothetical protein
MLHPFFDNQTGFWLSYIHAPMARKKRLEQGVNMLKPIYIDCAAPAARERPEIAAAKPKRINLAESPLGWLKARGMLNELHFLAGEALRRDYETAGLGPRVTMQWNGAPIGSKGRSAAVAGDATLHQLSAKARFDGALEWAGPGLSDILWRVVCAGESVPSAERSLGWPIRAGRLVLTIALGRIAAFYGVAHTDIPISPPAREPRAP